MSYALSVTFKSNEYPFHHVYQPLECHQPADEAAAVRWATGMQAGMGPDYIIVLLDDGRAIFDASMECVDE